MSVTSPYIGVFLIEWMTSRTMSPACLLGDKVLSAKRIDSIANEFQMERVYAATSSAKMVSR
jgi:hypothetical protein